MPRTTKPKLPKGKKVKAFMYLWPEDKKIQDGRIVYEPLSYKVISDFKLREFLCTITYTPTKRT